MRVCVCAKEKLGIKVLDITKPEQQYDPEQSVWSYFKFHIVCTIIQLKIYFQLFEFHEY